MALSFDEREDFLNSVGFVYKEEPCNVDFSVRAGCDVGDVFKIMKKYQNVGLADEYSSITFNGLTLVAGIYDNVEEFMETYIGVRQNIRDDITKNYKSTNDVGAILDSFDHINEWLRYYGYEPFSEEEQVEIVSRLKHNISNSK